MDKEEVVNIYNRIVLSRKKELKMPFAATLMDLEIIILSRVSQPCMCAQSFSCVRLFATPWTVACQPPLSTGFSRQEYWSGLPFPPPGDLPEPRIKLMSIELVMSSNHLILCCPLLFLPSIFPSIRVFSNELVLRIR